MKKFRNFMFEYFGRPGGALITLGNAIALALAGISLGEKVLIGVCVLLGLFVVAMVLAVASVAWDTRHMIKE